LALLLIALLISIAQNAKQVAIHYLGFKGHISLAVTLLLAAVGAVLLVAIPGAARIIQLRRALTKNAVTARARR
jgi:lipopolysaccharide assembly protein A